MAAAHEDAVTSDAALECAADAAFAEPREEAHPPAGEHASAFAARARAQSARAEAAQRASDAAMKTTHATMTRLAAALALPSAPAAEEEGARHGGLAAPADASPPDATARLTLFADEELDAVAIAADAPLFTPPQPRKPRSSASRRRRSMPRSTAPSAHIQGAAGAALESNSGNSAHRGRRACVACGALKTPQWRAGPEGPKTLCNACGVRVSKQLRTGEQQPPGGGTDTA